MAKSSVIEASAARQGFAQLGERAKQAPLEVTRHGRVEFVIISPDLYEHVKATGAAPAGELDRLQASFDQMFTSMQSDQSNAAYDSLERLSAEQLSADVTKAFKQTSKASSKRRPRIRVVR